MKKANKDQERMTKNQKWTGLICPACRFVIRIPADTSDVGAICPSCDSLFNIPQEQAEEPVSINNAEAFHEKEDNVDTGNKGKGLIGYFVKMAIIVAAVAAISVFLARFLKDTDSGSDLAEEVEQVEKPKPVSAEKAPVMSKATENARYAKVVQTVQKFLSSDDVSAIESMVRNPEVTVLRMREYYKKHPLQAVSVGSHNVKVLFDRGSSLVPVIIKGGAGKDLINTSIILEESAGRYLVDWGSWVAWSAMDWDTLLRTKPIEKQTVKVTCSEAFYYGGDYSDDEKWICLKLEHISSDSFVYGYMLREVFDDAGLNNMLKIKKSLKVTIQVEFPQGSAANNQVVISEFIHLDWIDRNGVKTE